MNYVKSLNNKSRMQTNTTDDSMINKGDQMELESIRSDKQNYSKKDATQKSQAPLNLMKVHSQHEKSLSSRKVDLGTIVSKPKIINQPTSSGFVQKMSIFNPLKTQASSSTLVMQSTADTNKADDFATKMREREQALIQREK